jgi:23S rRNA (cytosine1962-C5)-methyltransferase
MLKTNDIINIIIENSATLNEEFKRLFHGRGGQYKSWSFLTIDSIDDILSVAFYRQLDENIEQELLIKLQLFVTKSRYNCIVLQRRYIKNTSIEVIHGALKEDVYAVENGIKIKLNLTSNQNSGYFPDMKLGREYVLKNVKNKRVLNLFSYTCAFSLFALKGGALSVQNIDIAKSALTTGRSNHHLNNLDTFNVGFYPYNILKSFSRIKRDGPYDFIIIDPPTFQKGSFEASRDYNKIIKKLNDISSDNSTVLACLNSTDLDAQFIIDIFKAEAPQFEFVRRLENLKEFAQMNENKSLKNLVFRKK